jgi:LL-diaminopimelate aminotransferase
MVVTKVLLEKANRLYQMPPDLMSFARTEKSAGLLRRKDTIDLATFRWPVSFDTALSPQGPALEALDDKGLDGLKEELADWLQARYGCKLSADKHIYIGGSISGLVLSLALALVDQGDVAFVPQLSVPLYRTVVACAGGESVSYPVSARTNWRPDFEKLNSQLGRVARLIFINSPHNPTGVELTSKELASLIWKASRENVVIVNDAAYQSIPEHDTVSLLTITGARRVGVEVHSFSYLLGLPRMPWGFVAGNRDVISALKQISRVLSGRPPRFVAELISSGLKGYPGPNIEQIRRSLTKSRAGSSELAELLGLETFSKSAVPYSWCRLGVRRQSQTFSRQLFRRHGILTVPGSDFGDSGEGWIRFCLSAGPEAFDLAAKRVKRRRLRKKEGEKE